MSPNVGAFILAMLWAPSCSRSELDSMRPTKLCQNSCGIELEVNPQASPWDCDTVRDAVSASLRAFDEYWFGYVRKTYLAHACERAAGWKLFIAEAESFQNPWRPWKVAGMADCGARAFKIGNAPPWQSAFTHELVHVAIQCELIEECSSEDCDHQGWSTQGVMASIEAVSSELADAGK